MPSKQETLYVLGLLVEAIDDMNTAEDFGMENGPSFYRAQSRAIEISKMAKGFIRELEEDA